MMSVELLHRPVPPRKSRFLSALGLGRRPAPSVPENTRVYAMGDIHGCASLLDKLHQAIVRDAAGCPGDISIIYLGDYIDRGPDSKGVIDRLVGMRGFRVRFLKGNHDAALLDFLKNPDSYAVWRNYGAPETLLSYGVRPPLYASPQDFKRARDELVAVLPEDHFKFFNELELSVSVGDYFFAHAGARPGTALEEQHEEDLLWIREDFLSSRNDFGKIVVHGHSPQPKAWRHSNRIGVDTGAYATGILSCVVLEGETHRFLQTGGQGA